jgi:site-specific recombinase XerD
MALLPPGVIQRIDKDTNEIFYDVTVIYRGKTIAEEYDFSEVEEATNFYYKHIDRQNIKRVKNKKGVRYKAQYSRGYNKKTGKRNKVMNATFETMAEAVSWRKACRESNGETSTTDKAQTPFKNFSKYWLDNEVKVTKSQNTIDTYERNLRLYIWPTIGNLKLNEIKKYHINEVVAFMHKSKKSASTINLVLAMIGRCFNYALDNDILEINPMNRYKKQVKDAVKKHNYWEDNDIRIFFNYIKGHHDYPLYYTALRTGMRKGELLGLKWSLIDLERGEILVARTRTQKGLSETTKSKKGRHIPMTSDLIKILTKLKDKIQVKNNQNNYVFINKYSNPVDYQTLSGNFKSLQRQAGLDKVIRFHDLRHTFASQFILKGGDSERLKRIMGHSDLKMTELYTHLNKDHLKKGLEFIEKLNISDNEEN